MTKFYDTQFMQEMRKYLVLLIPDIIDINFTPKTRNLIIKTPKSPIIELNYVILL